MKRYIIEEKRNSVNRWDWEVEANSLMEAIQLVKDGEGIELGLDEHVSDLAEYSMISVEDIEDNEEDIETDTDE